MKQFKLVFALTLAISLLTGCTAENFPSETDAEPERLAVKELHCTTTTALSALYPAGGAKADHLLDGLRSGSYHLTNCGYRE